MTLGRFERIAGRFFLEQRREFARLCPRCIASRDKRLKYSLN
jgi:hypothetical protein